MLNVSCAPLRYFLALAAVSWWRGRVKWRKRLDATDVWRCSGASISEIKIKLIKDLYLNRNRVHADHQSRRSSAIISKAELAD